MLFVDWTRFSQFFFSNNCIQLVLYAFFSGRIWRFKDYYFTNLQIIPSFIHYSHWMDVVISSLMIFCKEKKQVLKFRKNRLSFKWFIPQLVLFWINQWFIWCNKQKKTVIISVWKFFFLTYLLTYLWIAALFPPDSNVIKDSLIIESLFIFEIIWSLGGRLT